MSILIQISLIMSRPSDSRSEFVSVMAWWLRIDESLCKLQIKGNTKSELASKVSSHLVKAPLGRWWLDSLTPMCVTVNFHTCTIAIAAHLLTIKGNTLVANWMEWFARQPFLTCNVADDCQDVPRRAYLISDCCCYRGITRCHLQHSEMVQGDRST